MLSSPVITIAADPIPPVAIIGGVFVVILAVWIGLNFLWNTRYRPMRMKKGVPTPTFNNILKRTLRFLFKEDVYPSEKIKQPIINKLVRWRNFYLLSIAAIVFAGTTSNFKLMGSLIFIFLIVVMVRVRKVFSARNRILSRMFEVSHSEFRYPRGSDLNPWGWVDIKQWEQLTIPGQTVVSFPASWSSEDPRNREKFERHFNGTVTDDNTWVYKWDTPNGVVTCEPVSHIPTMAAYPGSEKRKWDEIPLGVGASGEVCWYPSVNPHILICGGTGGGKSVAQRNIIFHTIQHADRWKFLGVDLKRVELSAYEPYDEAVLGIAKTLEDGVEVMRYGRDEMMRRYEEMEGLRVTHFMDLADPPPALMIMVDEAYMFMAPEGVKTDEGKERDNLHGEATTLIGEIARLGRAAGVHLIIATQRPDAKVIYGEIKENLAVRYAAGRMKTTASLMVLDSDTATRVPGDVKGRAVISVNGEEEMLQGYFAKPNWIDDWLSRRNNAPQQSDGQDSDASAAPAGKKKRGLLRRKANTAGMADIPDLDDGIISIPDNGPAVLPPSFHEDDEEISAPTPAVPSAKSEIEALVQGSSIDEIDEDDIDDDFLGGTPEPVSASPVQSSLFDDHEDEEEDDLVTPPSSASPMAKPPQLIGAPRKQAQEDDWDDDLDLIFADLPHNTPAERPSEASMRPRATLPAKAATGPSKAPTAAVAPTLKPAPKVVAPTAAANPAPVPTTPVPTTEAPAPKAPIAVTAPVRPRPPAPPALIASGAVREGTATATIPSTRQTKLPTRPTLPPRPE